MTSYRYNILLFSGVLRLELRYLVGHFVTKICCCFNVSYWISLLG